MGRFVIIMQAFLSPFFKGKKRGKKMIFPVILVDFFFTKL